MPKAIKKLSDRTHDLYDENIDLWELYKSASDGGTSFINSDNLFSHRLEDSDDFDERLDRSYYLNYCETVPSLYNSYIFKESIERPPDPNLNKFRDNTDRKGNSISKFIREVGFWSKVYGVVHVLVDMPMHTAETRADEKANNLYPYCTILHPLDIVDWSTDKFGNLNWILIRNIYYRDADPLIEREDETHYKLITKTEWMIQDEGGNPVTFEDGSKASGTNDLGIVPVISLYHKESSNLMVGKSLLKDIVYINRIIMNWCSCIDEQIERQTFSQLVVPDDGSLAEESESGNDPLHEIGTSSVWTFNADSMHPPAFISPDTANIIVIWRMIIDHIKEIFRLSGLIGTSDDMYVSRSGRAAQMGFLGVNSALSETAGRYQEFENKISKLAYLQLSQDAEKYENVTYPTTFDLVALNDEIGSHFKLMEKNFSVTLNKTIAKDLSRRAVPLAPHAIREIIEKEIESWSGIIETTKQKEDGSIEPEKGGDGNTNSNLGKTFRTKDKLDKEESEHRSEE